MFMWDQFWKFTRVNEVNYNTVPFTFLAPELACEFCSPYSTVYPMQEVAEFLKK